jgi:hypothetical protein
MQVNESTDHGWCTSFAGVVLLVLKRDDLDTRCLKVFSQDGGAEQGPYCAGMETMGPEVGALAGHVC